MEYTFERDRLAAAPLLQSLVALNALAPGGQAVLCGDPKQLGPTLRSPAAAAGGLAISLLESSINAAERDLAAASSRGEECWHPLGSGPFLPWFFMLQRNYRSSTALLELPSNMFYRDALLACSAPEEVEAPSLHGALEEVGLPVADGVACAFLGLCGEQRREGDSPSYYNALEASTVTEVVQRLMESGQAVDTDMAVITTYRRQTFLVRQMLRARGLHRIRVGVVDDLQGQEARIVIISTVLSRPESLPAASLLGDQHVGFWRNPRRMCVAVTRARAMLLVLGHPMVLLQDASWRALLKHCAARGSWYGAGSDQLLLHSSGGAAMSHGVGPRPCAFRCASLFQSDLKTPFACSTGA